MKLKDMMSSCISKPREIEEEYPGLAQKKESGCNVYAGLGCKNQEVKFSNYYELLKKIQQGEITLEVLENLRKLKIDDKKSFLADVEEIISNNRLHELNATIMKHALDLVDSKDAAFLLRRTKEDSIFRDLIYLEAKENRFTVEIDKKGTLKINLPSGVLKLYKLLIDNFYLKKFEQEVLQQKLYQELFSDLNIPFEELIAKKELQQKLYQELLPDFKIPFEELNFFENFIECLKGLYIKNSLARSIMSLFVSRDIKEHAVCEELLELDTFKKLFEAKMSLYGTSADSKLLVVDYVLNDVQGVYISNLASSNILDLVMHSQSNNETIESIEILGDSSGPV
ncbi:DUF5410 family protein [Rickettsia japonica]|uniref:Uncharacterized protein n=2 Tax=Rickettsia japonica TaxID=35790 RepID=A0AAD1CAS8_RICJA|nr:DUF5410 family protein [Rickettsia japonica]AXU06427.1 hypothetical protein D0Z68_02910 [Rickettsia japonica]QHE25101.1 hypothetical protein GRX81_05230 [Rickettsia japonica]BAK96604.1 hypothetical protein RJP_0388 [Rickettsia japonica YH]BAW82688.1 predicted protein [Rickettsia japonica]